MASSDVSHVYELLYKRGFIAFPLTEVGRDAVDRIVSNINNLHFDVEIYPTIEEKIVAYMYFLIKDHPFTDGNKRTASLVFEVMCSLNNVEPNYGGDGLDGLAVFLESVQEEDHQKVIKDIATVLFEKNK